MCVYECMYVGCVCACVNGVCCVSKCDGTIKWVRMLYEGAVCVCVCGYVGGGEGENTLTIEVLSTSKPQIVERSPQYSLSQQLGTP